MKNLFQSLLFPFLFFFLALPACLSDATAQQGNQRPTATLSDEMRTKDKTYNITLPNTGANANDITAGVNGVIVAIAPTNIDGGSDDAGFVADSGFTDAGNALDANALDANSVDGGYSATMGGDSGYGPFPYPCKLQAVWKDHPDSGLSATVACTGALYFAGKDQFGNIVSESITTDLTEAGAGVLKTERVYEELTYFSASTCANMEEQDRLQISCSPEIGMPLRSDTKTAIKSFCRRVPTEGTPNSHPSYCYATGTLTYDTTDYSVRLDNISGGPDAGAAYINGDKIDVRMRAPSF